MSLLMLGVNCKAIYYILRYFLGFPHSPVFLDVKITAQTSAEKMFQQTSVVHVTVSSTWDFTPNTHGGLIINYNQLKLSLRN